MIDSFAGQVQLNPLLKGQEMSMSSAFQNDIASSFPMPSFATLAPLNTATTATAVPSVDLVTCRRCAHPGVDVKLHDCGCSFHARCTPVSEHQNLGECPVCHSPVRSIFLMPMNFDEIDAARAAAATMALSAKRGKKRKNATIARLNPNATNAPADETTEGSDLRTGRWTTEETLYCDKMIEHFESGSLPITEGIKLNDFLANMLKSKQSRLTKKMKNARLSSKAYKYCNGYIADFEESKAFSALEKSFYDSIQCDLERAEIRFHMQKEWREHFSSFCVAIRQKVDADSWLSSVEEMDRRVSRAKDAARMARRKVMMGFALSQDSMNQERGVFIDNPTSTDSSANEMMSDQLHSNGDSRKRLGDSLRPLRDFSSPFVGRVIQYIDRHQIPFEHIDAWVPSFIPNGERSLPTSGEQQKCRLCFAGFATADFKVPGDGGRPEPMSSQDRFDLLSFGEYSSKFSFDVGCGLPGRVYSSGICSWEQGVANAPSHQFERCGGASQWGIKTVLGIPIPSPNVGRIVVLFYSRHDRPRDADMVRRITEELTKLMPTPKWKLVVDVGVTAPKEVDTGIPTDSRIGEVLNLLVEHTPTHRNSPHSPYLPGFEALRQLLVKRDKSDEEEDILNTTLDSYSSYLSSGRRKPDIAWMIARDFMLLSEHQRQNPCIQTLSTPLQLGQSAGTTYSGSQYTSQLQAPVASQSQQLHGGSLTFGGIMPHLQQKPPAQQGSQQSSANTFMMNETSRTSNVYDLQQSTFQPSGLAQPPTSTHQH